MRHLTGTWSRSATPKLHDWQASYHRKVSLKLPLAVFALDTLCVEDLARKILHRKRPTVKVSLFLWRARRDLNPRHPA